MRNGQHISVIIPALNEEASIGSVLDAVPDWVDEKIVVNNGSTDQTAIVASQHGARVIHEPQPGYGAACLRGISWVNEADKADIIIFLDADFSDEPADMHRLADPVISCQADLVLGDRTSNRQVLGTAQYYGNKLTCRLMALFWGHVYGDLGPFRAIRRSSLNNLKMADLNFGWTVEMQIKAIKHQLSVLEIPVAYRHRLAGRSKMSGTLSGIIRAGSKILFVIFREVLQGSPNDRYDERP